MGLLLAGMFCMVAAPGPQEGARVYRSFCATCHGARGDGDGPSARFLELRPRDFTLGDFEFTTVEYGSAPRVEDVERTVASGLGGTPMPAFARVLTAAEIRAVAEYVLALSPTPMPAGTPVALPEPTQDSPEARQRGAALYSGAGCASCHGSEGRADGPAAATLVTSAGHPIRPADLTRAVFKSGAGATAIFRVVSTGLAGTPMPSYARVLSVEQRWDLAHYVASLAHEPSWWARLSGYLFTDPAGRSTVR